MVLNFKLIKFIFILFSSLILFSQGNRKTDNTSLCLTYDTSIPNIEDSIEQSEYVFIGKVIEVIRTEKLNATDYNSNGPIDFESEYNYWFILEVKEKFKGNFKTKIKIYSRNFSGLCPILELNQSYLIYSRKMKKFEIDHFNHSFPYIYCGDRSKKLEHSKDDVSILRKMKINN
ncbi:hypothetical protein [Flavobacterium sp.]|uniref:hypothetical protein n=1 Tax=Flavobacterium sp. TaxID=239 RepID=UPI00404743D8